MKTKRFIAMLLCLLMCISLLPAAVFADEGTAEETEEIVYLDSSEEAAPVEEAEEAEESAPAEETEDAEEAAPAEETEDAEEVEDAEEAEESEAAEDADETEDEIPEEPETEDEDKDFDASQKCGDDLFWAISGTTLTIAGTGAMYNYTSSAPAPWAGQPITKVEFQTGITSIGDCAFYNCTSLVEVKIPTGVTGIGFSAFDGCSALANVSIPATVTRISYMAFGSCAALAKVSYAGSEAQWKNIVIEGGNEFLTHAAITYGFVPELSKPAATVANYADYVKLSWTKIEGAEKYRIFMRTGTTEWKQYGDVVSNVVNITGLTSGVNYTFMVRALFGNGTNASEYSNPAGILRLDAPKLSATNNTKGALLSWSAVAGASCYKVYYREAGTSAWTLFTVEKGLSTTVTGLTVNKSYEFAVLAAIRNPDLTSGFPAVPEKVTFVGTNLAAPKISVASKSNGICVSWAAIPGAEAYMVYGRVNGGTWYTAAFTTSTSEIITKINGAALKDGEYYNFMVRCVTKDAKLVQSPYSTVQTARMIKAPAISGISVYGGGAMVSWKGVATANSYDIYYRPVGGTWTKAGSAKNTESSFIVKGLTNGTKYEFTVEAIAHNGTSGKPDVGYVYYYGGAANSFILPTSNTKKLSNTDLAGLSRVELALARNEIFARHGYIFSTPELAMYFNARSWYKGTVSAANWKASNLNEIETYNVNLIAKYEKDNYGGSIY